MDMTKEEIKKRFKVRQVMAERGIEANRAGFCHCPFHDGDRTASLKIYDDENTWYCFGCGEHGDVISLVMRLDGVGFMEACKRLSGERLSKTGRRRIAVSQAKQDARRRREAKKGEAYSRACEELHRYRGLKRRSEPGSPEWVDAVNRIPMLEHKIDCMMDGSYWDDEGRTA